VDRCFCYLDLSRSVGYLSCSSQLRVLIWKISLPPSQSIYCRLGRDVVKSGRCEPTYWLHSILLSTTNNMQRYTIPFITVDALHVSGGLSAHHQELKNCKHSVWCMPGVLAATASGSSELQPYTYQMLCVQFLSS
jgi:hypothetical protein